MNIVTLSSLTARKRQLNQLCTAAVEQQVEQNKAENTQLRKRRRYLAKQLLKRVSLGQHHSNRHWLHAVTMVFALWGFNDLMMPNQAEAAPSFSTENPFAGVDAGQWVSPVFADIDGDGDLDVFMGHGDYGIKYFRNTEIDTVAQGTGFVSDGAANPLALVNVSIAKLAFADIDGDGDLDAFVGQYYNDIKYYRNTEIDADVPGTGFVADAAGNPLALVPYVYGGYESSSVTFADIDDDGDLDAFVGQSEAGGHIKYYRNTEIDADVPGTGFVADVAGNPLDSASGGFPMPTFADIDDDGDEDAFIGLSDGTVKYYRNTQIDTDAPGTGLVADAAGSPLANYDVGRIASPSFADVDGDGDLDAFIGEADGSIQYFHNTQFDPQTPGTGLVAENPLSNVYVGRISTPRLADVDGDGDLDAFVGELNGTIKYYRNTEIDTDVPGTGFVTDTAGNPLAAVAFVYQDVPRSAFADLDGDGDMDAFVGKKDGTIAYYRNTNIDTVAQGTGLVADAAGNPLAGFDVGVNAAPSFADIDGDGDLDAMIGEAFGDVKYYRNTEIDTGANVGFVADTAGNPFAAFVLGTRIMFDFADLDGDGDMDAFVGDTDGNVNYYRNTRIDAGTNLGFVADVAGNPLADFNVKTFAAPEFADLDGDGDLDAFIGAGSGRVNYFKNSDPVPVAVDDNLDAVAGVTATTVDVTANDEFKIEAAAGLFTISAFDATTVNGATVTNNGGNTFTYTALADFVGSDSFTYTLDDGAGVTAVATVLVNVAGLPTVDIQNEPTSVSNTSVFSITVEFSEDVTGFDALSDVTVINATVDSITAVDGNTYTVNISPDGVGDISIDIVGSVATSVSAGVDNAAATQAVVSFVAPTPSVPSVDILGEPTLVNNLSAFPITVEFSEDVTGFDALNDVTVVNGSINSITPVDDNTYTVSISPNGNGDISIDIAASVATSVSAGENNTAATQAVVSFVALIPSVDIQGEPTLVNNLSAFPVTVEFSEDVTGFDALTDVTVVNGSVNSITPVDGNTYTVSISPNGNGDISIDIAGNVATSINAGINNTAAIQALVNFDVSTPTVDIQGEPTLVNSLSAFPVTVEFSEDVTGFDSLTDVTVVNGTVNSITPVDGNTYTVSITPDGNGDISIDIADSVATSVSAGANNADAIQAVVSFDASAPVVAINANPTVDADNANIYVVSGNCSVGDGDVVIDISGSVGTASWLASCTMSGTWSASFDVSAVADDATDVVIDASQTDSAGNTGVAATVTLTRDTADGGDGGGGQLSPWSLLLLPLVTWLRRKNRKH